MIGRWGGVSQNFRYTKSRGHKWIIVNSCNAVGRVGLGRPSVSHGGGAKNCRGYSIYLRYQTNERQYNENIRNHARLRRLSR